MCSLSSEIKSYVKTKYISTQFKSNTYQKNKNKNKVCILVRIPVGEFLYQANGLSLFRQLNALLDSW